MIGVMMIDGLLPSSNSSLTSTSTSTQQQVTWLIFFSHSNDHDVIGGYVIGIVACW